MKRKYLSKILFLALAAVCFSFASCGGDDDDEETSGGSGSGTTSGITFMVPCTNWGATASQVKSFMSSSSLALHDETDYTLYYQDENVQRVVSYLMYGGRLVSAGVYYFGVYGDKELEYIAQETEKTYGLTLKKGAWNSEKHVYSFSGDINGKGTDVDITLYSNGITAFFQSNSD